MRRVSSWIATSSTLLAAFAAGCKGGPGGPRVTEDYFFPAPPDLPRVQYVRSFNGSVDFDERRPLLEYLAGTEDTTEYEVRKAFSVATWRGKIYVTDSFGLQGLNIFDLDRRRFYILGREPGPGVLRKPIHVFVDEGGLKYVSDLQRRQVVVYGADDAYLRAYGDGKSFLPVACVAHGKEVYVLDIQKDVVAAGASEAPPAGAAGAEDPTGAEDAGPEEVRRDQIVVLDKESGRPLRRIGKHGFDREGFAFASFLTVDRLGNLYVSDFLNHRIVKLDPQGNVLLAFGRHGDRAGDFAQMKGIALDRDGLIYVVDAAFQAVQTFDNAGTPLFAMGGPRAPQGPMDLPAGIWIDHHNLERFRDLYAPDFEPEYLILVANQLSARHRIAVYAYGKRKGLDYPPEDEVVTLDRKPPKALWKLPVFGPEPPAKPPPAATAPRRPQAPAGPAVPR
ncbi:MAG: hypothetical protein HY721_08825 [Planctomycetes bacterium]|nr:hypothetical protein [Planctomycetota bacterium]